MTEKSAPFVLTQDALYQLSSSIDNLDSAVEFLEEADRIISKQTNRLRLPVDVGIAPKLTWAKRSADPLDAENARTVYEYLGTMDHSNAADPRLWTPLALGPFRAYMSSRWPIEGVENWKNRVRERWVMLNPTRRSLVKHGIARLWWIADITYDGSLSQHLTSLSSDPYAYTLAALCNEDRVQSIFERELGSSRTLTRHILERLESFGTEKRGYFAKRLTKELTLVTGYRDLNSLTGVQIDLAMDEIADAWDSEAGVGALSEGSAESEHA